MIQSSLIEVVLVLWTTCFFFQWRRIIIEVFFSNSAANVFLLSKDCTMSFDLTYSLRLLQFSPVKDDVSVQNAV